MWQPLPCPKPNSTNVFLVRVSGTQIGDMFVGPICGTPFLGPSFETAFLGTCTHSSHSFFGTLLLDPIFRSHFWVPFLVPICGFHFWVSFLVPISGTYVRHPFLEWPLEWPLELMFGIGRRIFGATPFVAPGIGADMKRLFSGDPRFRNYVLACRVGRLAWSPPHPTLNLLQCCFRKYSNDWHIHDHADMPT
jgi:hypothetical protein